MTRMTSTLNKSPTYIIDVKKGSPYLLARTWNIEQFLNLKMQDASVMLPNRSLSGGAIVEVNPLDMVEGEDFIVRSTDQPAQLNSNKDNYAHHVEVTCSKLPPLPTITHIQ